MHLFCPLQLSLSLGSGEMESTDEDRACQAIIPGLPDDLALRCLAKISHGYHGLLQSVSKKWREVIQSSDFASVKAKEGWSGNWLFVLTAQGCNSNYQWDAYDPDADRWHPLPRIPGAMSGEHRFGFSCISVCKRFLVIGGFDISSSDQRRFVTNTVMSYDPLKNQWIQAANMRTGRADFACAVVCGKLYVAGGSCGTAGLAVAEIYDPFADSWDDLPPMPFPLVACFSISHGGEFHVFGSKDGFERDTYVIFNPVDQRWRIVADFLPFSKLTPYNTTVLNDQIYNIHEDGTIRVLDKHRKDWEALGVLPAVVLPEHGRPLKRFAFGFVGLQQYLYIVGGMALKYDSQNRAYDIVKLNSMKYCDLRNSPLQWLDAREMPRPSGVGVRSFSLEE